MSTEQGRRASPGIFFTLWRRFLNKSSLTFLLSSPGYECFNEQSVSKGAAAVWCLALSGQLIILLGQPKQRDLESKPVSLSIFWDESTCVPKRASSSFLPGSSSLLPYGDFYYLPDLFSLPSHLKNSWQLTYLKNLETTPRRKDKDDVEKPLPSAPVLVLNLAISVCRNCDLLLVLLLLLLLFLLLRVLFLFCFGFF